MKYSFIIIASVLLLVTNYYVFYRLWQMLPFVIAGKVSILLAGVFMLSFMFLSLFAGNTLTVPVLSFMYRVGTSWFFIFIYLFFIFIILDLLRITHLLPVDKYMFHSWKGTIILTGFITVVMVFGFITYHRKLRIEQHITIDKPLNSTNPLKIVALSDLHLGYNVGVKELEKWIELINNEHPDIVLIAGDLICNSLRPLDEQHIDYQLRKIESRYGVFMAPGNHEYISGIDRSARFVKKAGIEFLCDSAVLINNSVYIAGRDDRSNPNRKNIKQLIENLDKNKPVILLDHQPYLLEEAEQNHIDIQISGHTHQGQLIPISWITNLLFEKSHGYLKKGDTHIYVSSGIGIWGGKFRIGTRSEYIVMTINNDNS